MKIPSRECLYEPFSEISRPLIILDRRPAWQQFDLSFGNESEYTCSIYGKYSL